MLISKYEQLTVAIRRDASQLADKLLLKGWLLSDFPALLYDRAVPWDFADQRQRSWNFHIHSLDMLDPLLAAYSQTKDLKYLEPALRIGLDWVLKHPRDADNVSPMAWYDMAVGMRAYRLGYLYQAADLEGLLSTEQRDAMWRSLEAHRAELADDSKIAFHSNHGYFQVAGQLALGRRFQNVSTSMAALYSQGSVRLKRILDQQFGLDGVHREHSPDYHRMVADRLLGLIHSGLVESPELLKRTEAIEDALAWFVTPEGKIANFGDSDSRDVVSLNEIGSRKWTTPMMRAVASNGATGNGWPNGLKRFEASGYVVVRCPSVDKPDDIACDSYLAQTAAFHSRTHKHCDDLSFIWHEYGQPLLVDAGRYGYIGKTETGSELWQEGFWYSDPMRIYMESTRAHNTLEFDGKNSLRKGVKPYGSALVQACEQEGVFAIETRCKQHKSIWHTRLLLYKPGQWLIVFDVHDDNLKEAHDVRQWFHLAPGHAAKVVEGGYDVKLRDGADMTIRSLLGGGVSEVISGSMGEPIQGWQSEKAHVVEVAEALSFYEEGVSKGLFATLFSLSPGVNVDNSLCRSNITGSKGRFGWTDKHGKHVLEFERAEKFSLKYLQENQSAAIINDGMKDSINSVIENYFSKASVILEYGFLFAPKYEAINDSSILICVCDPEHDLIGLNYKSKSSNELLIEYFQPRRSGDKKTFDSYFEKVWEEHWFLHPDLVVVGGENVIDCLLLLQKRITRKVVVVLYSFKPRVEWNEWQKVINCGHKYDNITIIDLLPLNTPEQD